jgi:hypothetical protein
MGYSWIFLTFYQEPWGVLRSMNQREICVTKNKEYIYIDALGIYRNTQEYMINKRVLDSFGRLEMGTYTP